MPDIIIAGKEDGVCKIIHVADYQLTAELTQRRVKKIKLKNIKISHTKSQNNNNVSFAKRGGDTSCCSSLGSNP